MTSNTILGCIFLAGGAVGILMNSRMTAKRPNMLLTFGNAIFFIGPILFGLRLLAKDIAQMEFYGFGFALLGLAVMGVSFLFARR
jgi:hypothetical protein